MVLVRVDCCRLGVQVRALRRDRVHHGSAVCQWAFRVHRITPEVIHMVVFHLRIWAHTSKQHSVLAQWVHPTQKYRYFHDNPKMKRVDFHLKFHIDRKNYRRKVQHILELSPDTQNMS